MYQPSSACIDGAGDKCHTDGTLVRDTLQSTDEIGALKIL